MQTPFDLIMSGFYFAIGFQLFALVLLLAIAVIGYAVGFFFGENIADGVRLILRAIRR